MALVPLRRSPSRLRVFCVAPHPDDDVLGCGGTLARCADRGAAIAVGYVTDGAGSHPGSRRFPAQVLRELRAQEAVAGLAALGASDAATIFFGYGDGTLGGADPALHERLTDDFAAAFSAFRPSVILLPWRRDPHPDHVAASAAGRAAVARAPYAPYVLEYAVWLAYRGDPTQRPRAGEVIERRVDVTQYTDRKRAAIAEHRSQTGALIDDDPDGFRLPPEWLSEIAPFECFYEVRT
jgi:LmbE family N-acetylglucosaminyl deacetylase